MYAQELEVPTIASIRERMREVLDDVADPHDAAIRFFPSLSPAEVEIVAVSALHHLMREIARSKRHAPTVGESRFHVVRQDAQKGRINYQFPGENGWVFLDAATHDDLIHFAEMLEGQAQASLVRSDRMRTLAALLKKKRKKRVGDLDPERVIEILEGR